MADLRGRSLRRLLRRALVRRDRRTGGRHLQDLGRARAHRRLARLPADSLAVRHRPRRWRRSEPGPTPAGLYEERFIVRVAPSGAHCGGARALLGLETPVSHFTTQGQRYPDGFGLVTFSPLDVNVPPPPAMPTTVDQTAPSHLSDGTTIWAFLF